VQPRAAKERYVSAQRYWLETLGCPKNRVDSDKLAGLLGRDGYARAAEVEEADLVVVNTCAFIDEARQESIEVILDLASRRRDGSQLVVTGCLAERYGDELVAALPEVDKVCGFGDPILPERTPVALRRGGPERLSFDLLNLPRPPADAPWAYVKVAEGCDRSCGFCAIPSFRGPQRSRSLRDLMDEVESLVASGVREVVLVAQDLASYGRDRMGRRARREEGTSPFGRGIVELVQSVAAVAPRTRLLYLYPSSLDDALVDAILETGVPYFDLSLQHVSRPLLARMRRWGEGPRFLERIERIRSLEPWATLRSSFIIGYPGETEEDHDLLLDFLEEAQLDWAGFFKFSAEEGTYASRLPGQVAPDLALERLRECTEVQDRITAARRDRLVGERRTVLVDSVGVGRTVHEAPEIDGVVHLPPVLQPGTMVEVAIVRSLGTDLVGELSPRLGSLPQMTELGAR
jgi:ribosomal protein S12 methylthiotransferase